MLRFPLFAFAAILLQALAIGQSYTPMGVYTADSTNLIRTLRQQNRNEISYQQLETGEGHITTYRQTTNYLISLVRNQWFIYDSELNQLLTTIHNRIKECNPAIRPIGTLLIRKNGVLNATCYGEGTVSINLGLIANAKSHDEIAFTLAHEIAHFHLDHLRARIEHYNNRSASKAILSRLSKIPEGKMTLEDLKFIQSWYAGFFQTSRKDELQADSLAFVMLENCGFNREALIESIQDLSSVYHPPYPLKRSLFDAFVFEELPFKRRWFNPTRAQNNDPFMNSLLNNDSLTTHPDIPLRVEQAQRLIPKHSADPIPIDSALTHRINQELINAFYQNNKYDFAIHAALQLKQVYPSSSYINFQVSRMLHRIALAKNDRVLHYYVRTNTSKYPNETKALNHFLHNLTLAEVGELSYLYTKKNFDEENPDHYRVFYNILLLTNRLQEAKTIKKTFNKSFKGEQIHRYSDED